MRNVSIACFLAVSVASVFTPMAIYSLRSFQAQTPTVSKDAAAVDAGEGVFIQMCLQCHSSNEGQVTFGPSLYRELKRPHPKKSTAEIRAILKNGKGKMPSFKDKLTAQDADNLLAYLHTL
jgi:mono/diheme cytochrome c family protein